MAVNQEGVVSALKPGRAFVRVVTRDGGHRAECDVEVLDREIRVEGIVLNHASSYVIVDETRHLIAYITPENATNKKVYWSTSNRNIASVSRTGIVVGIRRGIAIISATTEDGGYVAECEMEVRDGWLDFVGGCSTSASTPAALLLVLPLVCLFFRR
ncbi:MAG: Ig domain-containing protein [Synergistaceae bacterium]|nr:Ig domain-containing protein [Synergistaceae bacterium]